ncbi:hypothetical protein [Streptomyces subrutilus]|uniref:Uncharacterized protein n=1 Tax=Streptomyces subrutilus TaxID=36818 RepID=A0A1E5PZT8_9ACTN|nr:hypothetical protein [Streptomyces subrutilus]OEJ35075.1 hypothetical protein BGK67_30505 [Streptomyces subrutilus]
MGGMKDKRQEPGKGREEQQRPRGPGQDPVHPEPGTPSRGGKSPEEIKRGREEDPLHGGRDRRDDDF